MGRIYLNTVSSCVASLLAAFCFVFVCKGFVVSFLFIFLCEECLKTVWSLNASRLSPFFFMWGGICLKPVWSLKFSFLFFSVWRIRIWIWCFVSCVSMKLFGWKCEGSLPGWCYAFDRSFSLKGSEIANLFPIFWSKNLAETVWSFIATLLPFPGRRPCQKRSEVSFWSFAFC